MGVIVTIRPPHVHAHSRKLSREQKIWVVCFAVGGMICCGAAYWSSELSDADLDLKLTGGSNYIYLVADWKSLKNRENNFRLWVCSTGPMMDVKYHIFPFGKTPNDPEYTSLGGAYEMLSLLAGCRWATPYLYHPGKFSVELEGRNGLVLETLEVIANPEGPYKQTCELKRNGVGEPLPAPQCV
jgi:hypothetical protein